MPSPTQRSSSCSSRTSGSTRSGVPAENILVPWPKSRPCFLTFSAFLLSSHSNRIYCLLLELQCSYKHVHRQISKNLTTSTLPEQRGIARYPHSVATKPSILCYTRKLSTTCFPRG